MPTRFPNGLNAYDAEDPLSYLPNPYPQLAGWSTWVDDFERYAGYTAVADSTGTVGTFGATTSENVYGHGNVGILTANTDADRVTVFPTPLTANTPPSQWGFNGSPEWIFACAFGLATSTAQGLAIGAATPTGANGVLNTGACTSLTSIATTNGIYVRKAAGSADIEFVWYRGASLQAQVQCVAAASVATVTRYKIVARQYKGVLTVWCNDVRVGTDSVFTNSPSSGSSIAPFLHAVQSGTGGAQTLVVDYSLFATRTKNSTLLPAGRV